MRNGRYQNVHPHVRTIADTHRQTQAATQARRALIQRMRQCPQCGQQMTPLYGRKVLRCPRCYHEQSYQRK
jgi:NADH pyrophosphatase NudC (nudix superfamily)